MGTSTLSGYYSVHTSILTNFKYIPIHYFGEAGGADEAGTGGVEGKEEADLCVK